MTVDCTAAALGTATATALHLLAARAQADEDPRLLSRWPLARRRARRRLDHLWETTDRYLANHRDDLIEEALDRAALVHRSARPWHRVDVAAVKAEVDGLVRASDWTFLRKIYADNTPTMAPEDLRLLEQTALALPAATYRLAAAVPGMSRPRRDGRHVGDYRSPDQVALQQAYLQHATLPREVIVWRGESFDQRRADFDPLAVLESHPGDILTRDELPTSTSVDPAVASRAEFTGSARLHHVDRTDKDGWVLKIRTKHAIYVGDRDHVLGYFDGLAKDEREAIVFAPRLRVISHSEGLFDGLRGWKRVHVVECSADELSWNRRRSGHRAAALW
jgi:hypothetical protein